MYAHALQASTHGSYDQTDRGENIREPASEAAREVAQEIAQEATQKVAQKVARETDVVAEQPTTEQVLRSAQPYYTHFDSQQFEAA